MLTFVGTGDSKLREYQSNCLILYTFLGIKFVSEGGLRSVGRPFAVKRSSSGDNGQLKA